MEKKTEVMAVGCLCVLTKTRKSLKRVIAAKNETDLNPGELNLGEFIGPSI